ncbi:MAG: hypothetical protein ACD_39C01119G0004 [uncultured bacterium]|nr:MAG: hypothetical protein ACD_39C01119G0004 [uncultured bacterium]
MKRGMVLPIILALVSILVFMAITRHYFSRQQMHFADLLSEREQAYYVASGMRKIGVSFIEKAFEFYNSADPDSFPKLEKADKNIKVILEKLINLDSAPLSVKTVFTIDTPTLQNFADTTKQSGIELADYAMEITFIPVSKLFEDTVSGTGIRADQTEITWKIILRCAAQVKDSRQTVLWYREGRTINLQTPVISKFSLFIRDPEADLNLCQAENTNPSQQSVPTIVANGTNSDRESRTPQQMRDLIDAQGWVYFGEKQLVNLRLNSHCALLNPHYFTTPLETDDYFMSMGSFQYYHYCEPFKRPLKVSADGLAPYAMAPERDFFYTTAFALNGRAGSPSPTLAIGRAMQSYPVIQGLHGVTSNRRFPFPMIENAQFDTYIWPCRLTADEIKMIRRNFSNSYDSYRQRMSFIYQEPLNTANFQGIDLGNLHRELAIIQTEALPSGLSAPPFLQRLKVNNGNTGFCGIVSGTAYSLLVDSGREIFSNSPLASLDDLTFVKNRVNRSFNDQKKFISSLNKTKGDALILPGAAFSDSELSFDKPITFNEAGGIIICNGNAAISADLRVESQAPLSIISLNGDIIVSADVTIDAALIALKGNIRLGRNTRVNGLVAGRFVRNDLSGGPAGEINYNQAFDCTAQTAINRAYRLCFDEKELYLVE